MSPVRPVNLLTFKKIFNIILNENDEGWYPYYLYYMALLTLVIKNSIFAIH